MPVLSVPSQGITRGIEIFLLNRNLSFKLPSTSKLWVSRKVKGHNNTTANYTIVDGGEYDEDDQANGTIVDPAGPDASLKAGSWWLPLPLLLIVFWRRRHKDDDEQQPLRHGDQVVLWVGRQL